MYVQTTIQYSIPKNVGKHFLLKVYTVIQKIFIIFIRRRLMLRDIYRGFVRYAEYIYRMCIFERMCKASINGGGDSEENPQPLENIPDLLENFCDDYDGPPEVENLSDDDSDDDDGPPELENDSDYDDDDGHGTQVDFSLTPKYLSHGTQLDFFLTPKYLRDMITSDDNPTIVPSRCDLHQLDNGVQLEYTSCSYIEFDFIGEAFEKAMFADVDHDECNLLRLYSIKSFWKKTIADVDHDERICYDCAWSNLA